MKKHILLLTHGDFGTSLIKSAEMIIGDIKEVPALSLLPEDSGDLFYEKVAREIATISKDIVCLVDLFGGSPCNTALRLSQNRNIEIICGLNLPMLLELYNQINISETFDRQKLLTIAKDNIFDVVQKFTTKDS